MVAGGPFVHFSRCAGEVAERGDAGEGGARGITLTRLALLADLSHSVGEVY